MTLRSAGTELIRSAKAMSGQFYRVRRGLIYACCKEAGPQSECLSESCSLIEVTLTDLHEVGCWSGLTSAAAATRLDAGERCFALMSCGRKVAALWLHCGACYVRGADLWIKSPPSTWYCYGIVTKPEQRRNGYYGQLLSGLRLLAKAEGIDAILQYVEASNSIPQLVLPRIGYEGVPVVSRRFSGLRRATTFDISKGTREHIWLRGDPPGVYVV